MKFAKPALTFEQQAQRLIDRGLIVPDQATLIQRLKSVNYHRLSAYWYPFRSIDPATQEERFTPGTSFEMVWKLYTFDRELRLLLMDALERVEVAILRTRMVEQFTLLHGPFGYTDLKNFTPRFPPTEHCRLINEIKTAVKHSKEEFIGRFRRKYSSEPDLPLWIAVEVMTFGQLFTIFRHLHRTEQKQLSQQFGLYPPVLVSWLHTLNFIRNACAHHARLWNRELPIRPKIPDKRHNPEWQASFPIDNRYIFSVLTLLCFLLQAIEPQNDWRSRFEILLQVYPQIPLSWMGIPQNWKTSPIWKQARKT